MDWLTTEDLATLFGLYCPWMEAEGNLPNDSSLDSVVTDFARVFDVPEATFRAVYNDWATLDLTVAAEHAQPAI